MTKTLRSWKALTLAAAAAALPAFAQEARQDTTTTRQETTTTTRRAGDHDPPAVAREATSSDVARMGIVSPAENDRRIARWLLLENRAILECSKDAQTRASNDGLKQFAQTMATEHQKCVDDLSNRRGADGNRAAYVAPNRNQNDNANAVERRNNARVRDADSNKTAVLFKDDGQSRGGHVMYRPTDFLAVREDVCSKTKASMKDLWRNLSGAEFDKAYAMHMVAAHECLLANLRAIRPTASQDMQAEIDRGIEKTRQHIDQCRQHCDQCFGRTGDAKNREPGVGR